MISAAIIHSNTRAEQIRNTLTYLKEIVRVDEIIIINDGPLCLTEHEFKVINVNRSSHLFCRAKLWDAAINASTHETVIILDGDRLPHRSFFESARSILAKEVMYCEHLMQANYHLSYAEYVSYICKSPFVLDDSRFRRDERELISNGTIPPKKNPMSGCVAFRKSDYIAWGGMSHRFKAYGFNDVDCYARAYFYGCKFTNVDCLEVHMYHTRETNSRHFLAMNAYNGVLFYDIWNLPVHSDVIHLLTCLHATVADARSYDLIGFCNYVSLSSY